MDIQSLTDKFNDIIKPNSWWSKFANSQFVQMVAVFCAQTIYIAQTYASRALTEGFISMATKRTSILAAAEDRGYVGRYITPSTGTVSITNKSAQTLTVPSGMELFTNDQTVITLMETRQLRPGETLTGLAASQFEKVFVDYPVTTATPFLTVLLDRELTQETADIKVSVVTAEAGSKEWTLNPLFRMSRETSEHYVMVYRPTEQIGVRFGNGTMGKMPPASSSIRLEVKASKGDYTLAIGQPLIPTGDYADLAAVLEIKTDTAIRSGAGHETTEETRNRAQYYVPYDEQVVWGGDYRFFVQTNVPNLAWLNVWGEQQQEEATGKYDVENINSIFFCGHRPGYTQDEVKNLILTSLGSIPNEMNKSFKYAPINDKPFTVKVVGIAKKSVLLTEAINEIKNVLRENFGRDSSNFKKLFENDSSSKRIYAQVKVKDLWGSIESLGIMISYEIELVNFSDAVNLNDFVYLDIDNSTFTLDYP